MTTNNDRNSLLALIGRTAETVRVEESALADARERRDEAIRDARAAGISLRELAISAGLDQSRITRIIAA